LRAVRLWGAAEALRELMGTPLPCVERTAYVHSVNAARIQLDESIFSVAWAQGRAMTPEQALAAREQPLISDQSLAPVQTKVRMNKHQRVAPSYPNGLTEREVEVLRLVAQGLSDAQVAQTLVISPRTVNAHLRSIYSKLNITSRTAATHFAIEQQLL
jgi:DNA-binding NarL/FixJ family response regulator